MQKPVPIGFDDFAEVRKNYYFVDKTRFIGQFLQGHAEVTLITRPRRFGKTMTLSMLRYFFRIEGAAENRKLFDGLDVARDARAMAEQGQHPVLFLTLKEWKYRTWELMQQGIRLHLGNLCQRYVSLLSDRDIDPLDKEKFQSLLRGEANLAACMDALALLLRMLRRHYGKKVILLLDEYDVPAQSAYLNGYYEDMMAFLRVFLTAALKTNPSLEFAVLTGVLRIAKESIFSDLNNLQVATLLNGLYPDVMGFTAEEVARLARYYGREDRLPELRKWYDGYRFAQDEIYNPWSVVNYFAQGCRPGFYWLNTSENGIIRELVQKADSRTLENLRKAMNGVPLRAMLREGLIYADLFGDKDALYTMLLTTGYLTMESAEPTDFGLDARLRIPNREILSVYRTEIVCRCQPRMQLSDLRLLMQALTQGDAAGVEDGLAAYSKRQK